MKKILNISNLYILLWSLYTLQGVLLPVGSLVSQSIFVVLMLISLYYAYEFHKSYKVTKYFKAVDLLLVMFIVYGVVLLMYGQDVNGLKVVNDYTYLQYTLMSFIPIYPFYIFSRQGLINKNVLFIWLFVFVVALTLKYFDLQQQILEEEDWEETINNIAYVFIVILPLICLFDDKKGIQYALWAYCAFFIISSFKRGAMLIGAICFIMFMFYSLKSVKFGGKLLIIIATTVIVFIGYQYIMGLLETSELFNRRLDETMEGDSSGRDSLYATFWNIFINQENPLRFLIGYGANGTLAWAGQYAHNDWLELAISQGLLGIIIYINYWRCSLQTWREIRKANTVDSNIGFVLGMTIFIAFAKSLFSMSFTNTPFYVSLIIGYCLGQYDKQEPSSIEISHSDVS